MKRNINKTIAGGILGGLLLVSLNSCLKNNKYYIDFTKVGTTVEMAMAPAKAVTPPDAFYYSVSLGAGCYTDTIQYSGTAQTVPVYVNVASPQVPNTPTTVTLKLDTAALSALNASIGGVYSGYTSQSNTPGIGFDLIPSDSTGNPHYELLPSNAYTVTSWTVTVPAGQRLVALNIQVNPSAVDTTTTVGTDGSGNAVPMLNHNYVLPISIVSASQKVSNWKTVLVNVQVMPQ